MRANWFIALPVAAGPWLSALEAPAGVRMFAPSDLHLTVAFLGAVAVADARNAFALAVAFPLPVIEVGLGAVVPLGRALRPSAFAAVLTEGREPVERAMTEARDAMFEAAGAHADTRPALAHVTLARPARRVTHSQLSAALRWARALELEAPRVQIDRIALYTWSADRAHTLFQIDRALPLRGGLSSTPA